MTTLFHSVVTTERHRKLGYCEASDFGKIELIELAPYEKELIVSFKYYHRPVEFIELDGYAYKKIAQSDVCAFSREEEEQKITSKQGKFSRKYAIKLILEIRETMENVFSGAGNRKYILIGKTLYQRYCEIEDLNVTVDGNCLFSHWISINIESHGGKANFPLNKTSLKEVVKERKAYWNSTKPNRGGGDGHSSFSQPTSVKWGTKYDV